MASLHLSWLIVHSEIYRCVRKKNNKKTKTKSKQNKKTVKTHTHTPTCPGIQSEDTIYTRVYSVFVPAFKARTNLCITHSKWGHFFTHLWTCLARTKRGLRPYPPYTHIMKEWGQCTWTQSEDWNFDLALSKCPHFECKKLILVLALNAGPNTHTHPNLYNTHTHIYTPASHFVTIQ